MELPTISIIVPCYNVEKYLPQCIESILHQSYQNIEIWLVDDGSPDKCGMICDKYAAKDERIHVIHKLNGGLSEARNVAIEQVTGEWITFVDSDDFISEDYIETLFKLTQEYNCEIAVGLYKAFKEEDTIEHKSYKIIKEKLDPILAIEKMFYQKLFDTSAWAKLYHRRLFESGIRYPIGLLYEDLPTTYLLMAESNGVAYTNKILYYYLLRPSSIEGAYNPKKIDSGLAVTKMMESNKSIINKVQNAYRCRKFSLYYHLVLSMPQNAIGRDIMLKYLKENKYKVLLDMKARKKARLAALFSILGFGFVKFIFSLIDSRK